MTTKTIRINKELVDKIPDIYKQQQFVDACVRFGLENEDLIFVKTPKPKRGGKKNLT